MESTSEKEIEKYLKNEISKINGKALKFISPGIAGVPDRLILIKGLACFVELKKPKGKPRALQIKRMQELEQLGFKTYVVDSFIAVNKLVKILQEVVTDA